MSRLIAIFLLLIINAPVLLNAQEKIITAGFQLKPIFSSTFLKTGPVSFIKNNTTVNIDPKSGFCFGMVIRKGFTKRFSAETAINYVKRTYQLHIENNSLKKKSDFSIIGYEVPLQGLVFIRLSKFIYMSAATGISIDFFPSNIFTQDTSYFKNKGFRRSWIMPSLIANLGWEYRTTKKGYIYLGASYHRPFAYIYTSEVTYLPSDDVFIFKLSGNYLTIDLRYFFHEKPTQSKKKKKSNGN